MASISEELDIIVRKKNKVVSKVAQSLLSELIHVTPVDTGALKGAWYIEKTPDGWRLSNNMNYASILFDGRRIVSGKEQGSLQLPGGINPVLAKYNIIMQQELNKIR